MLQCTAKVPSTLNYSHLQATPNTVQMFRYQYLGAATCTSTPFSHKRLANKNREHRLPCYLWQCPGAPLQHGRPAQRLHAARGAPCREPAPVGLCLVGRLSPARLAWCLGDQPAAVPYYQRARPLQTTLGFSAPQARAATAAACASYVSMVHVPHLPYVSLHRRRAQNLISGLRIELRGYHIALRSAMYIRRFPCRSSSLMKHELAHLHAVAALRQGLAACTEHMTHRGYNPTGIEATTPA